MMELAAQVASIQTEKIQRTQWIGRFALLFTPPGWDEPGSAYSKPEIEVKFFWLLVCPSTVSPRRTKQPCVSFI